MIASVLFVIFVALFALSVVGWIICVCKVREWGTAPMLAFVLIINAFNIAIQITRVFIQS